MKPTILILVIVMIFCGSSLSPIDGSAGTTVIDYCSDEHIFRPATWDVWGSFVNSIAQSFTGDGRTLNHCQFFLGRVFNPSGNIYAKLYVHSGTFGTSSIPAGAPLATSDPVDISTIPGEEGGLVTFNFPTPYTLINGTHYILAVEFNGGDSGNKLYVYTSLEGSYHSGNTSSHAFGSWNASANDDVIFYAISDQTYDVPDATEIILDNTIAGQSGGGRTFTGTWCASSAAGYYGTNSLYSCGSGTNTYRWTPTIPEARSYNVYVWWTAYSTRSTSVPVSVTHAGGTTTKTYNQQTGGGQWVLHGNYNFNTGTGGYVEVSGIYGQACADAVRFVPTAPTLPAVTITATDNTATENPLTTGTFTVSRTGSTAADMTVYYSVGGTATAGGDYNSLPGSVTIPAGSPTVTVVLTPIDDPLVESNETVVVTLSDDATYAVGIPASATVTISSDDQIILDNAAAGQSGGGRTFNGTWCTSSATGYYGTNSLYSCGSGKNTYRWTPTIPEARSYNVYVWWTAYSTRSTSVPISVTHAGGTTTKTYNQQTGGGQWVLLGNYSFNAGTGGFVEVSDIYGQACADAVRIVPWP